MVRRVYVPPDTLVHRVQRVLEVHMHLPDHVSTVIHHTILRQVQHLHRLQRVQ